MQSFLRSEAGRPTPEPATLDEWRKAHDALVAKEHAFSQLVTRCAQGQASRAGLEVARKELQAMRDLADAVFQKMLGAAFAADRPADDDGPA